MSFAQLNLDTSITEAINACGYSKPTPIQSQSIPKILQGCDIVACAQTGTGKTAAFVLPALHQIRQRGITKKPRVLILTPTRELAAQIIKSTIRYGKFLRFKTANLVGGMPYRKQLQELSGAVDLIVATPGRLLDHMEHRNVDISGIEMLIIDEADRMFDMGFIDDVKAIVAKTPKQRQTLLFSATVHKKLNQIIQYFLNDPIHIDLSQEKIAPVKITQELYMANNPAHKSRLLQHFLNYEKMFKAIIFTATKVGADELANQMIKEGYLAAPLHGDLKQNVRNKTIEKLHKNKIQYLVATDVAARGIDVSDITHVINYDLPHFYEDYVHRIGRTGRAGKTGKAISFALHKDRRHIKRIEQYIGETLTCKTIEGLEPKQEVSNESTKPRRFNNKDKKPGSKRFDGPHSKNKDKKYGAKRFDETHSKSKDKKFGPKRFDETHSKSKDKKFGSKRFDETHSKSKDKKFGSKRFDETHAKSKDKKFGSKRFDETHSKSKDKKHSSKRFDADHSKYQDEKSNSKRFDSPFSKVKNKFKRKKPFNN